MSTKTVPTVYQHWLIDWTVYQSSKNSQKTVEQQIMTIGVPIVTCLHRVRRIHKAAQTRLPCETSITCAWAVATARRPWAGLTVCHSVYPCVWLPFAAACCYTLFYLLMPTARLVCQRPSSNFPYFRIPLANFLLSRPNSIEYGNSKTTTLLPSLNVRVCEGHAIIRRRMNISETVQDRDNYNGMLHWYEVSNLHTWVTLSDSILVFNNISIGRKGSQFLHTRLLRFIVATHQSNSIKKYSGAHKHLFSEAKLMNKSLAWFSTVTTARTTSWRRHDVLRLRRH